MGFEAFERRLAHASKEPFATIQRKGPISFNRAAVELVGIPESVVLLYDAERKLVGLKPAETNDPLAFTLRSQGKNTNTYIVAGHAFARYFGLDTSVARRYPVSVQEHDGEGVLVIDLKGGGMEVSSPRLGRSVKRS